MNPKPQPPFPGGEYVQFIDTGPQGVSPNATRVNLIAVGDGGQGPLLPRVRKPKNRKPALPTADEISALPRAARAALAARCALRVAPLGPLSGDGSETAVATLAAVAILRVAADPREVRVIRRDFERLRRLARVNGWADDTPIPPDVFGPLWPKGHVPAWARETGEPRS